MGQLAAENLDDIRQKYKRMSRVVLSNMKIREQMLSTVHCQVKDLWAYAQSLVRVEVSNSKKIELYRFVVSFLCKNYKKDDTYNKILTKIPKLVKKSILKVDICYL